MVTHPEPCIQGLSQAAALPASHSTDHVRNLPDCVYSSAVWRRMWNHIVQSNVVPSGGLRLAGASAELWAALGCAAADAAAREFALRRALQLEPRSAFAWTALGRLYAEAGGADGRGAAADCYLQVCTGHRMPQKSSCRHAGNFRERGGFAARPPDCRMQQECQPQPVSSETCRRNQKQKARHVCKRSTCCSYRRRGPAALCARHTLCQVLSNSAADERCAGCDTGAGPRPDVRARLGEHGCPGRQQSRRYAKR